MRYNIKQKATYTDTYIVNADTEEEAIEKVFSGDLSPIDTDFDFADMDYNNLIIEVFEDE